MATSEHRLPDALLDQARREYERARWRGAIAIAWFVAPMTMVAVRGGAPLFWSVVNAVVLTAMSAALLWRGQEYGSAVLPGIIAGATPYLAPMLIDRGRHLCALGSCLALGSTIFFAAGLVAGSIVSAYTMRRHAGQRTFLLAACAVAASTGLFGCITGGLLGVLGMLGGFASFTVPSVLRIAWQRR